MQAAPSGGRILVIMRDQYRGDRLPREFVEHPAAKIGAQRNVEAIKWLIQQQRPRPGQQGTQQADPRPLAAGKRRRIASIESRQTGALQRLLDPGFALGAANVSGKRQQQILPDAEVVEQQRILEQNADTAPLGG